MRTVKIFLASSQELKLSRDEFERFIRRKNDSWAGRNITLQLIIWEDFIDSVSQTRKQDDYNKAIRESDILLVLVFNKVGKYTKEEFETGYDQFLKTNNPAVYTYFQSPRIDDGTLTRQDSDSYYDFDERLKALNHFKTTFKNNEELLFRFSEQLDKLFPYTSSPSTTSNYARFLTNIPRHTEEFIGREEDMKEMKKVLDSSEKIVLMNGMGGIGKTTLAKKYVQSNQKDYDHIVWIDVKTQDSGNEFDMTISEAFIYDPVLSKNLGHDFTKESIDEKFRLICNSLSNIGGKNLLVIDNAKEDLNDQDIKSLLPGPPNWQVIVTSRQIFKGFQPFEVLELSPEQAKKLFRSYYTKQADEKDVDELLKEISYHTLTIELLAKTLSFDGQTITITEAISRLKNKQLSSPELQRKITLAHSKKETESYIHLIQTFNLSLLTDYENWLMKQFAFLLPRQYEVKELEVFLNISKETEKIKLHEALNNLGKKGWLKTGSYGMHRMIQQMVYYQLDPKLKDIEQLLEKLSILINPDPSTDYSKLFHLIPYAEFILLQLKKNDLETPEVTLLQNNLGIIVKRSGDYEKAKALVEAALNSDIKIYGEQHSAVAIGRSNLAGIYQDLGDLKKARDLLELALESELKNFGEQHSNVARCRSNLALVYMELNEYEKARNLLESALESAIKTLGDQHPYANVCRSNLAVLYGRINENTKGRELLETALENDLKNFGDKHPTIAIRFNNLGAAYAKIENYKKAEQYFKKSLQIMLATVGPDHPNTKTLLKTIELISTLLKK